MTAYELFNDILPELWNMDEDSRSKAPSKISSSLISNQYPPVNYGVDINGSLIINVALAGKKKEDIDVNFEDNYLTIEVGTLPEKEESETEEKEGSTPVYEIGWIQRGFREYDYAKQSIFIDTTKFDIEKLEMKMEDGMLDITIPKLECLKPRKIQFTK